jgi:hypothetical protein
LSCDHGHINEQDALVKGFNYGITDKLGDTDWTDVKSLLRMTEYHLLVELKLARDFKYWSKVLALAPQSENMKELFEYQRNYFLEKHATE